MLYAIAEENEDSADISNMWPIEGDKEKTWSKDLKKQFLGLNIGLI